MTTSVSTIPTDFHELMDRLTSVVPVIRQEAEINEELGQLGQTTLDALHEVGAFSLSVPRALGGHGLTPGQIVRVVEKLSHADPATGWTVMAVQLVTGAAGAFLPATGREELFGAGVHPLIAGQGTRAGTAVRVEGGYLVSGNWSFGSGMLHATHVHSAAFDKGNKRPIVVVFPREQAQLEGNWDVMGLRATGSVDYSCRDLFVPDSHVYDASTTTSPLGGVVHRLGMPNMSAICHTGWALGVGRRLLDEMKALAQAKSGGPGAAVDTDQFHAEYARAEALLRSARAWALEVWADNEATLEAGGELSMEQETVTRLMLNNATWAAHGVGEIVHLWAATALARRGELQKLFRDLNVGTGHITSSPVVRQACGRYLAGLAPDTSWSFIKLVGANNGV